MSFDILRTLDNDELRFGVLDYHIDGYLTIEVTSSLPFNEIDSKIKSVLEEEWDLFLVEKKEDFEHELILDRGLLDCSRGWESTGGTLKYKVEAKPLSDHQIISKKLMKPWGTELFVDLIESGTDSFVISFTTCWQLESVDHVFRKALPEFDLLREATYKCACDINGFYKAYFEYQFNKTLETKGDFYVPANWAAESQGILEENALIGEVVHRMDFPEPIQCNAGEEIRLSYTLSYDSCPDCKDGFYYPLVGPPEPCRTCKS